MRAPTRGARTLPYEYCLAFVTLVAHSPTQRPTSLEREGASIGIPQLYKISGRLMLNSTKPVVQPHQREFVEFLVSCGALTFGDFTTKSGRKTPYFVNMGKFDDGRKIGSLGEYYAAHLQTLKLPCDVLFGPAYKGIPLAVTTAIALATRHSRVVGYAFDRKEEKTHGDKGIIVGRVPRSGEKVVIVEDVITAGTTLEQIVPFLRTVAPMEISGVIIAVDRSERGKAGASAVQEAEALLGIQIFPIVSVHHIVAVLSKPNASGLLLDSSLQESIARYLAEFGA